MGVKKPIWMDKASRKNWKYFDENLINPEDISVEQSMGRLKLTPENSDVWELWFDVDNKGEIMKFTKFRNKRLIPFIEYLLRFGIPKKYIYIKNTGEGFHVHIFVKGLPKNLNYAQVIKILGLPLNEYKKGKQAGLDRASLDIKRRVREFGAKTSSDGYCSYITIEQLGKFRNYPLIKEPRFPEINIFKITTEFMVALSQYSFDLEQERIEKDPIEDFERDGDFNNLEKCPLIKKLIAQAKQDKHLPHWHRFFLMSQYIHFGEHSRKRLHEILKPCSDYKEEITQKYIDHAMNAGYHPCTCKWAQEKMLGCPSDCKGSGGKSPIKFAWSPISLEECKNIFRKWLCFTTPQGNEDDEILDVILAIALDRKLAGDPVWIHIVADSGGIKSELIRALKNWNVVELDSITSHTLVSGKVIKDEETGKMRPIKGLLTNLNGKILTIKDLTILLQADPRERYIVFSQFRGAYDGYYAAAYGTWDKPIRLDVEFTVITGVTRAIDYHGNLAVILGERFLKIRHNIDRDLATQKAMSNDGKEKQMRKEVAGATLRFLGNVNTINPKVPKEIFEAIRNLALFIAQVRMSVPQQSWKNAMVGLYSDFEVMPEYATRLGKQLLKLTKLIAIVRGKHKVDWKDYFTTLRVGMDTCPQTRAQLILYIHKHPNTTFGNIQKALGWDYRKTKRKLAIVSSLWNVLEMSGEFTDINTQYKTSRKLDKYIKGMTVHVGESVASRIYVFKGYLYRSTHHPNDSIHRKFGGL